MRGVATSPPFLSDGEDFGREAGSDCSAVESPYSQSVRRQLFERYASMLKFVHKPHTPPLMPVRRYRTQATYVAAQREEARRSCVSSRVVQYLANGRRAGL